MRVLGIDPGLRLTGYGCVEPARAQGAKSPPAGARIVEAGVFKLDAKSSVSDRLAELEGDLVALLERVEPDLASVEQLYAHYKHPATAIVMGHARGVILLALRRAHVPLVELRPNEVKKASTGYGHAAKDQIQRAMQFQFGLKEIPKPPDVADALAIALTAMRRESGAGATLRPR
ncbi:MAG TPA: crossover junction endodeoxyribonuclease RuvC [Phycisphaerales bacterium]|nr:crossover junction endodeoxyribonuclease RuvC [Phycisphaerales bacterium]